MWQIMSRNDKSGTNEYKDCESRLENRSNVKTNFNNGTIRMN